MSLLQSGKPDKPVIFATGSMVSVADHLVKNHLLTHTLYSVCQIKPLNETDLDFLKNNSSYVITIEEHNMVGGLGSTISEIMSSTLAKKVLRIGASDRFTSKCGSYEYAMKEHGLSREQVLEKIKAAEVHF